MDSKIEILDPDIDINRTSDYPHKAVSAENTTEDSTNQSNTDGSQLNKMPEEEIASISKVEDPVKTEEFDVCMVDTQNSANTAFLMNRQNSNEEFLNPTSSEENLLANKEHKSTFNIKNSQSHRQNAQYFSESSDSETDSSDSSDCDEFFANLHKSVELSKAPVIKSLIEDLPPVEYLSITANPNALRKLGIILHWVIVEDIKDYSVIVLSAENSNPLDEDSVLFLSSNEPLGKIHEVLGSVNQPQYRVRFNNAEDIFNKHLTKGQSVFYLPEDRELTHYVLVDALKKQKGSDASWKDNNEPPEDQIDYSDDEQEKLAKQKRRAKNRRKEENGNVVEVEDAAPNKVEKRQAANNPERHFLARPSRSRFKSPASFNPPRSSFRSYSPRSFCPTPPPPDNFGYSGRQSVSSPQPFRTFPQSNVSRCWPLTITPTSQVSASSNFASSDARIAPQLSSPTLMAAPQNNVPLQQQLLLQPQHPITSFLSRPPPNYNFNSNPRAFLHHHQSFTPPTFGALCPQSNVSQCWPLTIPPTSQVSASSNFASSDARIAPQLNSPTLMAAPQNNVPLQQQLLLQPQQPITSFLSRPPPNYNFNSNPRAFLHQHESFTPPTFGALCWK